MNEVDFGRQHAKNKHSLVTKGGVRGKERRADGHQRREEPRQAVQVQDAARVLQPKPGLQQTLVEPRKVGLDLLPQRHSENCLCNAFIQPPK